MIALPEEFLTYVTFGIIIGFIIGFWMKKITDKMLKTQPNFEDEK